MASNLLKLYLLSVIWTVSVNGDFDCACNYNVEKAVYPSPDTSTQPFGYLYEFDCKAIVDLPGLSNQFVAIQFERKLGYVEMDNQVQRQTCGGLPSGSDLIPSTTPRPKTTIPAVVNGQWSEWQEWAQCATSCGDGTRSRTRNCDNPAPSNGGQTCPGDSKEDKQCDNGPCPIDGEWSVWNSWSSCSVSCEAGTRTRNRTCSNPVPEFDGKPCSGDSHESGVCDFGYCPVDGSWTTWTAWSKCSVTCGSGTHTRNRTCVFPVGVPHGNTCVGESTEFGSCAQGNCPVDGIWATWSTWSKCSVTCGNGTHTRSRSCNYLDGSPHGKTCSGASTESGSCNQGNCPVDGVWAQWAAWSQCSTTCGDGTHRRQRQCFYPLEYPHGNDCSGLSTENGVCNLRPCPVDGHWASWQTWSSCSVTCANGTRTRTRTCTHPAPANGGQKCVGGSTNTEACNPGPCPVDGQWANWQTWSSCSVTCANGTRTRTRTCTHPAPAYGGHKCVGSSTSSGTCNPGPCPVDGQWANWQTWSSCSVTCANGTRTRTRTCTHPAPLYGGSKCVGSSTNSGTCNPGPCPVNGHWTSWQTWSSCSVTCANGTRTRIRTCTHPAPAYGGNKCAGSSKNSGPCNPGPCPVDGQWASWQTWSSCSVTCANGTRTRTRTCTHPAPLYGGSKCVGTSTNSGTCNPGPCPVNGQWASWQTWSSCSVTCANGTRTRIRTCTHPAPAHGGNKCAGSSKNSGPCNPGHCPVDGHWANWQTWSSCSVTCANGTRTRTRTCTHPAPLYGGSKCVGSSTNSGTCNPGPCPVDGRWASWQTWSSCSVTCANGTRTRTRTCTHPAPAYGGHKCVGSSTSSGTCNPGLCPVDGTWGTWTTWSKCSTTCGAGTHTRKRTCKFPVGVPHGELCVGTAVDSGSCNVGHCPVDGQWASWAAWSKCSVTCAAGTRQRARTCTHPAPAYHGKYCAGSASQTGNCNNGHCPVDGQWGSWSSYGACSVTCESGHKIRTRKCNHPAPAYGGHNCPGSSTSQTACHLSACIVNVTGTPYQFLGVGYNLLTGNPEVKDPGLMSTKRIFQMTGSLSSVREATYQKYSKCTPTKSTVLLHGSKAYQDELKNLIRPDSSHNSHILDSAFTYNSHFETMRNNLDNKDAVYLDKVTTCALGSLVYNTGGSSSVSGGFSVSKEFAKELCALPMDLSASSSLKYMHFLDTWGTSIVSSIDVGTKTTDRYTSTPGQVYEHVQKTDTKLFEQGGEFQGFNSSVIINTHDYTNSHAVTGSFGTKHTTNLGTSQTLVPVGGEVISITEALNTKYWQTVIDGFVKDGVCPSSIKGEGLQNYADSLHMALGQYANYKDKQTGFNYSNTQLLDRHNIQVPINWPLGTYGLMQPVSGCPGNGVAWYAGYVIQDTEDSTHNNVFSTSITSYLKGRFLSTSVRTDFCIKTSNHSTRGSQYDHTWPSGTYCILKKGHCPTGFSEGYIHWDDEDTTNGNRHYGTLPDGIFTHDTRIYYCCRHDRSARTPILLPTAKPFVLVRYGTTCQIVMGMSVKGMYIVWDDQSTHNKDTSGGVHPFDDGGTGDHKLHFCYYYRPAPAAPPLIG